MILTLSHWVFQLEPQKLGNKFKPTLLRPIQIPTPWIREHDTCSFKLLSLRVICYTTMQLELSVIRILWDGADISHIHLHQAKWMWTQLSALVHLNLKGGGRVCSTHLSCCLWLEPGVHVPAHKVNWFHSSNSKWFPIRKLLEPCLFFNTNHLPACGKWNHEIMQLY